MPYKHVDPEQKRKHQLENMEKARATRLAKYDPNNPARPPEITQVEMFRTDAAILTEYAKQNKISRRTALHEILVKAGLSE